MNELLEYIRSIIHKAFNINALDPFEQVKTAFNVSFLEDFSVIIEDLVLPIGLLLVTLRCCIYIAKEIASQNATLDVYIRAFLRLVIGVIITMNIEKFMLGASEFSIELINNITNKLPTSFAVEETLLTELLDSIINRDFGVVDAAALMLLKPRRVIAIYTVLVLLSDSISGLLAISITLASVLRAIRMAQAFVFAPVTVSDFSFGGLKSNAFGFLKNYLAMCLEPVLIVLALTFCAYMNNNFSSLVFDGYSIAKGVFSTIIYFAIIAFIFKSSAFAKEIVN